MPERPARPERPDRPERGSQEARVKRDKVAEKLKREDDKVRRRAGPVPNPIEDVKLSGTNAEADSDKYHEAFQGSLSNRMKAEDSRRTLAIDSEFYIVVCFQHRVQKKRFLELSEWDGYGDKYLDGYYVAEKMGLDITTETEATDDRLARVPPFDTGEKVDKSWLEFVDDQLPERDAPCARDLVLNVGAMAHALEQRPEGLSTVDKQVLTEQIQRLSKLL